MWPITKLVAGAAIATALGTGCTASGDEVQPKPDRIFFPTGAAVSPDGTKLFVTNANSDLRYVSGSISIVPLPRVEDVAGKWVSARELPPENALGCLEDRDDDESPRAIDCCRRDPEFTETLVCDEDLFLRETSGAGVQIGNFATDIAIQYLGDDEEGNERLRLVVPTRGDPSIAWADWGGGRLSCTDNPGASFAVCDPEHRLSFLFGKDNLAAIPDEPFGVFADSAGQFAMVTHLTTGAVTLIDSPRDGVAQVSDIQGGIFAADPTNGLRGATGVAGRNPNAPGDIIYVGSRSEDRIQTFTVGRPANNAPPFLLHGSWFFLEAVGNNSNANSGASDTRGMAFSQNGDRLYLINRKPPTLQILDTSIGPTGVPKNQVIGAVDICRQASTVTIVDSGDGERAYLTCFQDGQIYVVDPRGRGRVEDIITVGRGPYAVAAAPGGRRLYVTNFLEDTVAVIDLTPGSPMRNRVVLRIGEPRSL